MPKILMDCRQKSEARSCECVGRTRRRNAISLVTFKTRNFLFCTLGVFVVAIRLLSVLKEDAYIRFTEKKVTVITF